VTVVVVGVISAALANVINNQVLSMFPSSRAPASLASRQCTTWTLLCVLP